MPKAGISIDRFEAGKIAERWIEIDVLGGLQQTDAVKLGNRQAID
jgi:hypothetical protein